MCKGYRKIQPGPEKNIFACEIIIKYLFSSYLPCDILYTIFMKEAFIMAIVTTKEMFKKAYAGW